MRLTPASANTSTTICGATSAHILAVLVCFAVLGCGPPSAPPPTVSSSSPAIPAATVIPADRSPVELNLRSAPAFEVLAEMEAFGHEPVLVDAAALATLRCAGVSVKTLGPVPVPVAAEKIATVLRAMHYRVEHASAQWVVSVDAASPPAACTPPAPPPAAVTEDSEQAAKEVAQSIRRVSDTEYVITRRGFEVLVDRGHELLQHARLVPEQEGGKVVGIRLFDLPEDGTFRRLGLRNGDRLERLAGQPIHDNQTALEAYAKVRNANRVALEITRDGARVRIVYRVE
jgi:hypothetical protein